MITVSLHLMRQYEADGRKPAGYVDRVLPLAAKVDATHAYFEPEVYRRLAEESGHAAALAFVDSKPETRNSKPEAGVGDHLHDVIAETTGARPTPGCGCGSMRTKMNAWGPEKCGSADHRPAIIDWMCEQAKSLTMTQQLRAARKLMVLTFRAGAEKMLDEAIRRGRAATDHVASAGKMVGEGAAK